MKFWEKSLMARLVSYFLLLSLLPVAIVGFLAFWQARASLREAVFNQLNAIVVLKEAELNRWISDRKDDLIVISRSPEVRARTAALIEAYINETPLSDPAYQESYTIISDYLQGAAARKTDLQEIFILDAETGRVVYSTNKVSEGNIENKMAYFVEGRLATTVQNIYISPTTGRPTMTVATPLIDEKGNRIGVLATHLNLDRMDHIVLEKTGLSLVGETYLVNSASQLVNIGKRQGDDNEGLPVHTQGIDSVVAHQNGQGLYLNYVGVPVIGVYHWLDALDVGILAEISQEEAFASARSLGVTIFVVGLLIASGLTVVIRVLAKQIADPILTVTRSAVRVAAGDLNATSTVFTEDEIGILARTFNQMTERLRRLYNSLEAQVAARTNELAHRVEQLNLINQVGQNANSLLEIKSLLTAVAKLIRETLNYYTVMIILVNEQNEEVYLAAMDSVEDVDSTKMIVRMPINQSSIITHVAQTAVPLVVNDVSQDARYMLVSALPKTRSELALPLSVGHTVLGVLDLQSEKINTFSPDDVTVLQTMADQIAVTIQNARLFKEAQDARAEAEEANRLKTQFLTNMSHELRTPLNAVINFAYLLTMGIEGQLTAGQADMLNRIGAAGNHLLGLINDILDLAKIESGRIELIRETIAIGDLVKGVMSTAMGLVRGKNIELLQEVPDSLPEVYADRGRIRQVLLNLVSNAAKFTEKGYVRVFAEQRDNFIVIGVEDTGIGLKPEDIPKAFMEFVQVDGEMTRKAGGTGLGLPISKRFIEMHGGSMWVESEVEKGSIFYFSLPIEQNETFIQQGKINGS